MTPDPLLAEPVTTTTAPVAPRHLKPPHIGQSTTVDLGRGFAGVCHAKSRHVDCDYFSFYRTNYCRRFDVDVWLDGLGLLGDAGYWLGHFVFGSHHWLPSFNVPQVL